MGRGELSRRVPLATPRVEERALDLCRKADSEGLRSPSALPKPDVLDRGFRNWHSSSYRESRRVFVRFFEIQPKSEFPGFCRKLSTFRRLRRGALYPAELRVLVGST